MCYRFISECIYIMIIQNFYQDTLLDKLNVRTKTKIVRHRVPIVQNEVI